MEIKIWIREMYEEKFGRTSVAADCRKDKNNLKKFPFV